MQSLTRLQNSNERNLSIKEQAILDYIKNVSSIVVDGRICQRIGIIDRILNTDGIYPYYQRFLQADLPSGLYAMDNQRFYTPVDSGQFGLHHLVSVPKEFPPLYGLTRYKFSKIYYSDKYIIIFVGCVGIHGRNRFLSQIKGFDVSLYNVIPCAGVNPVNELSYLLDGTKLVIETDSNSDESDDSNNNESSDDECEGDYEADERML
jgi:hypothetical protein